MAMPSDDEAFGVAYIEAMAAGVPAVGATGEPGPAEIRGLGEGIELVPPRDPPALAGLIETLLDDQERLAALGRAARETVAAHFSWEACGQATLSAYARVLGQS
jgi:glycosyltransferase involved in cell wall biosynthesis